MNRDIGLKKVSNSSEVWDIIIIGGGSTGLGAAVDAAARGYKTLLLEQSDFGKGTSSRSTKLIHGGVRYLKQGNLSLVFEALHERGLMRKNAPHISKDQRFIIPAYKWVDILFYGIGLKLYDFMSGKLSLGKSKMLSRKKTLQLAETINPQGLSGGVEYMDGQFDDARFAVNLAQTASDLGSTVLNYMKVKGLIKDKNKTCGVIAKDIETDIEYEIQGKVVINATGIFTDEVRHLDKPKASCIISVSQGTHIVVDKSFLPGDRGIMIPKTEDGRVLFVIPWLDHVVIGTTDIPVKEPLLEPRALKEEIEFIFSHAKKYLTRAPEHKDALSIYSGLRPLVDLSGEESSTSKLSREHAILVSDSKLITITGGKWTTYRKMGQDVINMAEKTANFSARPCITKKLKIHGGEGYTQSNDPLNHYGSDMNKIKDLQQENPELAKAITPNLPYTQAETLWAVRHEMARTVEDILSRRTRSHILGAKNSIEAAPAVAKIMAKELKKDTRWETQSVENYKKIAQNYILP